MLPKFMLLSAANCAVTTTFNGGPSFEVTYDQTKSKLKYAVTVPNDMWFALAYGSGMSNVDMVRFQGKDSGVVEDLWSAGYYEPSVDTTQSYVDTTISKSGGIYTFETYRALNTGDSSQDIVLSCDQN